MAATVTFRGSTLLSDGEGVASVPAGGNSNQHAFEESALARGYGVVLKDLGTRGTAHTMEIVYVCHDSGAGISLATAKARIDAALDPTAGAGTLVAPGLTLTNCVLTESTYERPRRVRLQWTTGKISGWVYIWNLTFRQVR